jgi:hypothetical protein
LLRSSKAARRKELAVKFSSQLILAWMFGRRMGRIDTSKPYQYDWKDAILAGILAKNEALDKDGSIRKMVENGATDSEIREREAELEGKIRNGNRAAIRMSRMDRELADQREEDIERMGQEKAMGFWQGFKRGFSKGWSK